MGISNKLSSERLTEIIQKDPFNIEALDILKKRATVTFKCQERAKLHLDKIRQQYKSQACLGYKDEAYATESEMLNGFKCNVNDLSESEMDIYNML